jgi:hypothetical protein
MQRPWKVLVVDSEPSVSVGGSMTRGLRELGHDAHFFDQTPWTGGYVRTSPGARYVRAMTRPFAVPALNLALLAAASALRPQLVLVLKGAHLYPETVASLRRLGGAVAVFHPDDLANPLNTNPRMLASLPAWDVIFTPRHFALPEIRAAGGRRVEHLPFGFDPSIHHPARESGALAGDVADAVVFLGTAAPERVATLAALARDTPVRIFGDGWSRLPPASVLNASIRRSIYGAAVREVFSHSGINLSLLRRANRDLHQMRTFEVPACAGFMLAERTEDHRALFDEGREAAFFEGQEELGEQVRRYRADAPARRRIAEAGHRRLLAGHHSYRDRAARVIEVVRDVL